MECKGAMIDHYLGVRSTATSAEDGPDFSMFSMSIEASDESVWRFDRDTIAPDITASELMRILSITLLIPDGVMARIKDEPGLIRHFHRMPPT